MLPFDSVHTVWELHTSAATLLLSFFPLYRRQISSDITYSPLSSAATKTKPSKRLEWWPNKSLRNSANSKASSIAEADTQWRMQQKKNGKKKPEGAEKKRLIMHREEKCGEYRCVSPTRSKQSTLKNKEVANQKRGLGLRETKHGRHLCSYQARRAKGKIGGECHSEDTITPWLYGL